jgi:translocation and assembly module TamA
MRAGAARWAALAVAAAALLGASGCASLPFGRKAASDEPEPRPTVRLYTFAVESDAADARRLLETHLDLARFQTVPEGDTITPLELDRLAAAAPGQVRALLETEGWFEPEVRVVQTPPAQTGGLPHVAVEVTPGPRTRVGTVGVTSAGPLAPSAGDRGAGPDAAGASAARLERLRSTFPLRPGQPFRQDAWTAAKNASLAGVRRDGHAAATWNRTKATVDVERALADLTLELAPGPLYRLGPVRIEGLERYDATTVRNLATFRPGAGLRRADARRLPGAAPQVGLFEGASVELETEGVDPQAAPVTVRLKELTRHQATFGVGYSADTGPRFSVEAFDRKLVGRRIVGRGKLEVGPELRALGGEATSYPDANLWRRFVSAQAEQLLTRDEERNSAFVRAGRSKDDGRFDRLLFIEAQTSRVGNAGLATSARALTADAHWLMRDVDSLLSPTTGQAIAVQGALGVGQGSETVAATGVSQSARGPIGRVWTRLQVYRPLGSGTTPWFGQARVELGQVFARARYAVPDPLLFRAGGDDSVRGYSYRSLGPEVAGLVVSGRVVATGTIEVARPFVERLPDLLGAVFVDAGNAADRWKDLKPVVGVGVGLRYRSPVGPIRFDVAYGEATHSLRLHFSAGVRF